MHFFGILTAFGAFIFWGVGDFFIQRTSRYFGVWPSTFCITGFGSIILLPFAWNSFPILFSFTTFIPLVFLGVGTLLAGLATFSALKEGKIAVIEPILSFELPLTILVSVLLINENMSSLQMLLVALVFGGILLIGYAGGMNAKQLLERGALLALLAAFLQAGVNFATGLASRGIGPVEAIWFVHTFVAIACVCYFTVTRSWHVFVMHIKKHPRESFALAVLDNGAWVLYSLSMTLIPISLSTTISGAYIILTILLGVTINKEKLLGHQWAGVIVAVISVLTLSIIS